MPSAKFKKQQSPKRCKHCSNKAKSRGLCDSCRIALVARINRGEITELEAIRDGWIDKPKNRGPKATSGLARKFEAARRNAS